MATHDYVRKNQYSYAHNRNLHASASVSSYFQQANDEHHHHHHHYYQITSDNSTENDYSMTTSVTIRVTPRNDYLASWAALWALFLLTTCVAAIQVRREQRSLQERRDDVAHEEAVSSADETRGIFRILLLVALLARVALIPMQIWPDPIWWQFFGDTFPEMIFASAWTTLAGFFVQLVSLADNASGSAQANASPGIVIQATASVVYTVLICLLVWNAIASILLYALLCCIYAALFGTAIYYCPRLLLLLKLQKGGLAVRLVVTSTIMILLCLAHALGYARLVVAPPNKVYWWWNYGVMELAPSILFLLLINTSSNTHKRHHQQHQQTDDIGTPQSTASKIVRTDSTNSAASMGRTRMHETSVLIKGSIIGSTNSIAYGATAGNDRTS